jgi:hypothetical protein
MELVGTGRFHPAIRPISSNPLDGWGGLAIQRDGSRQGWGGELEPKTEVGTKAGEAAKRSPPPRDQA